MTKIGKNPNAGVQIEKNALETLVRLIEVQGPKDQSVLPNPSTNASHGGSQSNTNGVL